MAVFTINPNRPRSPLADFAALERDNAAMHHFDGLKELPDAGILPEADIADAQPAPAAVQTERQREPAASAPAPAPASAPASAPEPAARPPDRTSAQAAKALLAGLFASLPPAGAPWPASERAAWFQAADGVFHLIYRAEGAVRIESGDG